MDPNLFVVRRDDLMSAPVAGDIVFLNPGTDSYVALDAIGRQVWDRLATPCTVGRLIEALTAEFDGPPAQIAADVTDFLAQLQDEGMITVTAER